MKTAYVCEQYLAMHAICHGHGVSISLPSRTSLFKSNNAFADAIWSSLFPYD